MKPSLSIITSILIFGLLVSGGCSTFPPAERSTAPIEMPEVFSLYTEPEAGPGKWWQTFDSRELNALVEEALAGNFDIRTAAARIRQAEAEALKAGADLYPELTLEAGGEKAWEQTKTDSESRSSSQSKTVSTGLSAGYELDLWGRLRALHTSELMEYRATQEDLETAAITVAADVVTAWLDILSIRQQVGIVKEQILTNQRMLDLQKLRFMNGQADSLDVSQQIEALAEARAVLPPLELEEEIQLSALSVLLGRADKCGILVSDQTLPDLIPLPGTGLPADLLASRPDVRAAGLRLKEADWQVSVARADRLPAITLSAAAAFSSSSLDLLFSNWISTLAASVTGPLFDAGYRAAEVQRARAEADAYLTAYAQTVAGAVKEVEDCLVTEKHQTDYIRLLNDQLAASRLTLKDAHLQYMNGMDNYLSYMSAWTSVQSLERQLVEEQADLIKNRVALYRTLGGDWTRSASAPVSSIN